MSWQQYYRVYFNIYKFFLRCVSRVCSVGSVTVALWPYFAHYFCCFLCCGSLLICKQLLQAIATLLTLLKSKVTHPKYSFMQLAGKISTSEWECTSGEKCTLSCVYLYIWMHQHTHNFPEFVRNVAPFTDSSGM